ncbi:MAG: shikimate dehydrogenase, partial [Candidatus Zixiibacteriota bacterium]
IRNGYQGLSVTIPHKMSAIEYLSYIDETAQLVQAVNSVLISDGKLHGFNTDCYGFSLPLKDHAERLAGGMALVLGSGGAARAAIYSLISDYQVARVIATGRSEEKLHRLKQIFNKLKSVPEIETEMFAPENISGLSKREFDIVVNCTPLGGSNHSDSSPLPPQFQMRRDVIYYDVNYNDDNSPVKAARKAGAVAIDGSMMLVGQAVKSFELWTGEIVPVEPIYHKVFGVKPA